MSGILATSLDASGRYHGGDLVVGLTLPVSVSRAGSGWSCVVSAIEKVGEVIAWSGRYGLRHLKLSFIETLAMVDAGIARWLTH